MTGALLGRLLAAVARRPGIVAGGLLVLTGLAAASTTRLRVETDILSLIPSGSPEIEAFADSIDRFGALDLLIGVVALDGADPESSGAVALAESLARSLRLRPEVRRVETGWHDLAASAEPHLRLAPLLLPDDELDAFLRRVGDPDVLAREMAAAVRTPSAPARERGWRLDPAGLAPALVRTFAPDDSGAGAHLFDPETGALVDPGRRMLLVLVRPSSPAADVDASRRLLAAVREDTTAALKEAESTLTVSWTGGPAIAAEDERRIRLDAIVGAATALGGVTLLLWGALGRPAALALTLAPLLAGSLWTFGLVPPLLGRLNVVTAAFAALLIGLGVDFVIVFAGRYSEERAGGGDHLAALRRLGSGTAPGIVLGAVTTAATFLAFLGCSFAGLAELGLLTGVGILLMLASVFLILPLLLGRWGPGSRPLAFPGATGLVGLATRSPRRTLVLGLGATAALAAFVPTLKLADASLSFRAPGNPAVVLQAELADAFGLRLVPMLVRVDAPDLDAALQRAREILPELEALRNAGTIARVEAPFLALPTAAEHSRRRDRILRAVPDPSARVAELRAAFARHGLAPAAFADGFATLARALSPPDEFPWAPLLEGPLGDLMGRYVSPAGADREAAVVLSVYPTPNSGSRVPEGLAAVAADRPDVVLTGPVPVSRALEELVWEEAGRALAIGALAVAILLGLELRSLRDAGLALFPVGVALPTTLGLFAVAGRPLGILDLFMVTLVVGIGVDYGIHLVHRWREVPGRPEALVPTCRAICVAAATTLIGFGSLALSHYPPLRSMGTFAAVGATTAALAAVVLVPAWLAAFRSRSG